MNMKNRTASCEGKRMLSFPEGCVYSGLGRNTLRKFATDCGALKRYGSRVLIDRNILDRALDELPEGEPVFHGTRPGRENRSGADQ